MSKNYINIQNNLISSFNIDICNGDKCSDDWSRTHAHIKERRVCKWKQANSIQSTLILFHEVGHIENNTSTMRRCEEEFYATDWALKTLSNYGITDIPEKIINEYQDYIYRELDRGVRRGGKNYPSKQDLKLKTY